MQDRILRPSAETDQIKCLALSASHNTLDSYDLYKSLMAGFEMDGIYNGIDWYHDVCRNPLVFH